MGSVHIVELLLLLIVVVCSIALMIEDHFPLLLPKAVVFDALDYSETDEDGDEGGTEDDDDSNVSTLVTSTRFFLLDRVDQAHLQLAIRGLSVYSVDLSSGPGANLPVHCLRIHSQLAQLILIHHSLNVSLPRQLHSDLLIGNRVLEFEPKIWKSLQEIVSASEIIIRCL